MATSHVEHWNSADQKPNARLECTAPAIAIGEIGNTEIWDRKIGDPFKLHWKLLYNKSLRYPQISFPMFPYVSWGYFECPPGNHPRATSRSDLPVLQNLRLGASKNSDVPWHMSA